MQKTSWIHIFCSGNQNENLRKNNKQEVQVDLSNDPSDLFENSTLPRKQKITELWFVVSQFFAAKFKIRI